MSECVERENKIKTNTLIELGCEICGTLWYVYSMVMSHAAM